MARAEPKRKRGRPVTKPLPPRIDATPEELAKALLSLPADHQWEFLKKQESETKRDRRGITKPLRIRGEMK